MGSHKDSIVKRESFMILDRMENISACMLFLVIMSVCCGLSDSQESPLLRVSPSTWLNVGDNVTLSCEVKDSSDTGWSFSWHRADTDTDGLDEYSNDMEPSVKDLEDCQRGSGGSYSLTSVSLCHTGLYICGAKEKGNVIIYSKPQLLWVADPSPPASLSVSPNRSQHSVAESVSLCCEARGNSNGWRVRVLTNQGALSTCSVSHEGPLGPACAISTMGTGRSGVYWCESGSGEYSNAINITVSGSGVILESPALPLTVGDSITLRCKHRNQIEKAQFYKDGSPQNNQLITEMTLHNVSLTDEGMYRCSVPSRGSSPESWVTVRALTPGPTDLCLGPSIGLGVVSLVLVITAVIIFLLKKSKDSSEACPAEVTYADVRHTNRPTARVQPEDVTYAQIVIEEKGGGMSNKREDKPTDSRAESVYSAVRSTPADP